MASRVCVKMFRANIVTLEVCHNYLDTLLTKSYDV